MSGNSNFTRKYTISKSTGPGKYCNDSDPFERTYFYSITSISTSPTVYINSYALKGIGVQYRNPTGGFDPVSMPSGWVLPRLEDTFRVRTK